MFSTTGKLKQLNRVLACNPGDLRAVASTFKYCSALSLIAWNVTFYQKISTFVKVNTSIRCNSFAFCLFSHTQPMLLTQIHSMNVGVFLCVERLKCTTTGCMSPYRSKSASFSLENFFPSILAFAQVFMVSSESLSWRKKSDILFTLKW